MATTNNMTFKIAGAAGQGVESSGAGFVRRSPGGLHIFGLARLHVTHPGWPELFPSARPLSSPCYVTRMQCTFCFPSTRRRWRPIRMTWSREAESSTTRD